MEGCRGADKPWRAQLCRGETLGKGTSWSWDLCGGGGHLRDQMSWWGISGGISQLAFEVYGDIHCSVWHDWTGRVVPAFYQPPHVWLSERCWNSCFLLWAMEDRKKRGAGNTENTAVLSWHQQNTGFVVSVAKHNFSGRCHRNTKHLSESVAAGALWRLEQLWRICLLLVLSNVYLKWGCIRERLLQNYKQREGEK